MYQIPFVDEKSVQNFFDLDQNQKLFSLYMGNDISYILKTDGVVEEKDTWIDKRPYQRDILLKDHGTLARCDFIIHDANLVLIQKEISGNTIQDFYFNHSYFESLRKQKEFIYSQIEFNEKEKIRVKALKYEVWKL